MRLPVWVGARSASDSSYVGGRQPFTYSPGPDETYYLSFAENFVAGGLGLSVDLAFMDPLYGYFLGLLFYFTDENLFALYAIQVFVDVLTVAVIYSAGKLCWSHRAGLLAGYAYALTATAIFFTTTVLKPTLASFYVACWILLTMQLNGGRGLDSCFLYGVFLGIGIALRSNFLLLAIAGLGLSVVLAKCEADGAWAPLARRLAICLGLLAIIALLAGRNHSISGESKLLPANGGVVLHQLYNPDNPFALEFYPSFVGYGSPTSIMKGYQREAEHRLQRPISIYEMSGYWRKQAIGFIAEAPYGLIWNMWRKTCEFFSYTEMANNRSFNLERQFSTILNLLPNSIGVLLALGLPGLVLIGSRSRCYMIVCFAPLAVVFVTFIVFIAASRFRMHGMPVLAIGTGVVIAALLDDTFIMRRKLKVMAGVIVLALCSVAASVSTRSEMDKPLSLAWAYVNMGDPDKAQDLIGGTTGGTVLSAGELELLGFISLRKGNLDKAIEYYTQAAKLLPDRHVNHYNLSLVYAEFDQPALALKSVERALNLVKLPEYLYQKARLLELQNQYRDAIAAYQELLESAADKPDADRYRQQAVDSLTRLEKYIAH